MGFTFSSLGIMPHGWGFGVPWGGGGGRGVKKKSEMQPDLVCDTYNGTLFLGPRLLWPKGGAKRSNIIKSQLQSQFQRF